VGKGKFYTKVCMKGKCLLGTVLLSTVLIGCGSEGISQEEYDRVVAERDELGEQSRTNEDTLSHFFKSIDGVTVSESGTSGQKALVITCYGGSDMEDDGRSKLVDSVFDRLDAAQSKEWFDYNYVMLDFWSDSIGRAISMTIDMNNLSEPMQMYEWYTDGTGGDENSQIPDTDTGNEEEPDNSQAEGASNDIIDVDISNCHVKYISHEIVENMAGDKCLAVYYEFTNNDDEAKSFSYTISDKAFQNGIELDTSMFHVNDDSKNSGSEIKPGVTITVCSGFVLRDETAEVELEVGEWITLKKSPDATMVLSLE